MNRLPNTLLVVAGAFAGLAISLLHAEDAPSPAAAPAAHGDAAAGEKVFVKCKACHQIGESAKNAIGPELNGVIGRHSGSVPGYNYSDANKNSGLTWDEATFREYIKNPKAKVPGTKMIFAGLTREKDVDDIVAFLEQYGPDGKKKQ
jgi:cytochrome c